MVFSRRRRRRKTRQLRRRRGGKSRASSLRKSSRKGSRTPQYSGGGKRRRRKTRKLRRRSRRPRHSRRARRRKRRKTPQHRKQRGGEIVRRGQDKKQVPAAAPLATPPVPNCSNNKFDEDEGCYTDPIFLDCLDTDDLVQNPINDTKCNKKSSLCQWLTNHTTDPETRVDIAAYKPNWRERHCPSPAEEEAAVPEVEGEWFGILGADMRRLVDARRRAFLRLPPR